MVDVLLVFEVREYLLQLLVLEPQLPLLFVLLIELHVLVVLHCLGRKKSFVEAEVLGDGLQHAFFAVVVLDFILEDLVLGLKGFFERFIVDETSWFVVEGVYLFKELDMLLDEFVGGCVQLVELIVFVPLEEDEEGVVASCLVDFEGEFLFLAVGPVGVLHVGRVVEVVVVVHFIVLLP